MKHRLHIVLIGFVMMALSTACAWAKAVSPEQAQQAEDDQEYGPLREKLLADVGEAEEQFFEEEGEGHEQPQIPDDAEDGLRYRAADDRVVEDEVRQRLAQAAQARQRPRRCRACAVAQ